MIKLIKKYLNLTYKEKNVFSAKFSLIFNTLLAIGKITLSIFKGVFFLVSGILNVFITISKLECYRGIKEKSENLLKHVIIQSDFS